MDDTVKDFLLSGIIETRGTKPAEISADADADWNEQVIPVIGPHLGLLEAQEKATVLSYGMRGGTADVRIRTALLHDALKRFGLDEDPSACAPNDQQIVLLETREASG